MKKTLLICHMYPFPEKYGAGMRTMNFARFFREYGTVDIAYSDTPAEGISENGIFLNEFHLKKKEAPVGLKQRSHNFIKGQPYPIQTYRDDSRKLLESLLLSENYDYILVRYIKNAFDLLSMKGAFGSRVIIDFDDVMSGSLYDTYFYPTKSLFKRFLRSLNKKLLQNYEKRCLRFAVSLFCSEGDRNRIVPETRRKEAFVVPNIYDNAQFEDYDFGDGFKNENTLLFVGTLNYPPNVDGLKWFVASVYKEFRKRYPAAKLLVVGRNPSPEVRKLCVVTDGIELHADVSDIREYYRRCGTVVVPLLAGGGTRIKILEASLAGRPVLSTPVGAEGLDLADETDLLLFKNGNEFIAKFSKLRDRNCYNSLCASARKVVLDKYSKQTLEDTMKRVLNHVDERKGLSSLHNR
jgi:polysaccharide biosynthesis protein PslH